ncbi:MAG: hypothetical protein LBL44_04230 [Treponema sp.]|nr:hypothetical protein [Treponema sp.]
MKRLLLLTVMGVCVCALAAAQATDGPDAPKKGFAKFWAGFTEILFTPQVHKPFSVAGGIELTQNDRTSMLPEIFVMSDYELSRYFGFGLRGGLTFSSNKPEDQLVSVMEGSLYGRFYVYDFGWIRPFVQTGLGVSVNREQDYEVYDVLGEVSMGARAHWKGWFLEPSFRVGYPFRLAFGMAVGHSFLP